MASPASAAWPSQKPSRINDLRLELNRVVGPKGLYSRLDLYVGCYSLGYAMDFWNLGILELEHSCVLGVPCRNRGSGSP
jgi:hypothetical protein